MVTTSTMAALPIRTPSMVREAFSLSPARARRAKRTLSSQRITRPIVASGKRIVSQQIVAGILSDDTQLGPAHEVFQMWYFGAIGEQIASAGPNPKRNELPVVDERVGCSGRAGAILQVVVATVQQQRCTAGVKENR